MEYRYNFKMNKNSRHQTATWTMFFVTLIVLLYVFNRGSFYVPVWFLMLALCLLFLFVMSIPKYIKVSDQCIDIHCFVELTRIPISNIAEIKTIDKKLIKKSLPIAGSYGFGGYFGYYLNLKNWTMFRMYARQWGDDFVMITDVYEDVFVINCKDAENFIGFVKLLIKQNENEKEKATII